MKTEKGFSLILVISLIGILMLISITLAISTNKAIRKTSMQNLDYQLLDATESSTTLTMNRLVDMVEGLENANLKSTVDDLIDSQLEENLIAAGLDPNLMEGIDFDVLNHTFTPDSRIISMNRQTYRDPSNPEDKSVTVFHLKTLITGPDGKQRSIDALIETPIVEGAPGTSETKFGVRQETLGTSGSRKEWTITAR